MLCQPLCFKTGPQPPQKFIFNGSMEDMIYWTSDLVSITCRSVHHLALDVGWTDEKNCFGWHHECCPKHSSESQHLMIV
jgi:hypothetical protein